MRKDAYDATELNNASTDEKTQNAQKLLFVSKFEVEYVETLRSKLREHYIDLVLQKRFEVPEEINFPEVEGYGAISELAQLAIAIAEWTLELEITAYTLEGLTLYNLLDSKEASQKDYLKTLKKGYSYKKKSSILATTEYVLRRVMNFAFGKVSSLALAKGLSRGGFQGKDVIDLLATITTTGQVPWHAVAGTLNLTWAVGGYLCSHFFQKLNDYAVKKEVLSNMNHVQETFEANKLYLMTERKTLMDLVEKTLTEEDNTKHKWDLQVLVDTVKDILEPVEHVKNGHLEMSELPKHQEKMFRVEEEGDCVVVDENEHQEHTDDASGVIVVEW